MKDVKWMVKKCGLPILLLLLIVMIGVTGWGKLRKKERRVADKIWESLGEIESSEVVAEETENAEEIGNTEETENTENIENTESIKNTEASTESAYCFIPQSDDCLISDEEKKQLQSRVLSAAESVSEIYKDIEIADTPGYFSGICEFTSDQRKAVVEQLGRNGLVSVAKDTAMQNYEAIETFYADYLDGRDSMVTVYEVYRDGVIGAMTFITNLKDVK